jgi:hypothetical protein
MKRIAILVVFILLSSDSPRLLLAADDHRWDETVTVTLNGKWIITEIETPIGNIYQENEPITLLEGKVSGEHTNYRLHNDGRSIDWIVADEAVTHTLPGIYRIVEAVCRQPVEKELGLPHGQIICPGAINLT